MFRHSDTCKSSVVVLLRCILQIFGRRVAGNFELPVCLFSNSRSKSQLQNINKRESLYSKVCTQSDTQISSEE